MKKFIKDKITLIQFIALTVVSFFVYFNNYYSLVNFHLDPPLHVTEARANVESGKLSLIGPSIASKEVMGRNFFLGPFYYYVIGILGILTRWDVVAISSFFTLLWPITFIAIFIWFYKKFGSKVAIVCYSIFSFIPWYVMMSRQIWNPQFIPLIGIFFLIFLLRGQNKINYFWAGLFWGLGLAFEYLSGLWILAAGFFILNEIRLNKFKFSNWMMFPLGVAIPQIPLILFELRHDFYNLRTIIFHIQYGKISQGYKFNMVYYYAYSLLPFAAYIIGLTLHKYRNSKHFKTMLTSGFILSTILLILSLGPMGKQPLYPFGWSVQKQLEVANIIAGDQRSNFQVAETLGSDTRAMELRWWLDEKGLQVMDVASYPKAPILYFITTPDRPPETETVWEVSSMKPFRVDFKKDMGDRILLYKLVRI